MKKSSRKIRVSWIKGEKRIFGAFKWNAYVIGMYEDIFKEINEKHGWETQYGSKYLLTTDRNWKSSIHPKDIEEFINRNKQLYDIFVKGISSCDLFIADITNHNPNVLIELGIAIQMNKNILIVTSQDINKLPFDIRGYEAKKYRSREELQEIIEKEIKVFDLIKNQSFESGEFIRSKKYSFAEKGILTDKQDAIKINNIPKLRNLRISVDFKFIYSSVPDFDWFGVNLRTQGNTRYHSELVLVRHTGETRSLTWAGLRGEKDGKKISNFKPDQIHTLEILIDENRISASVDDQSVIDDLDVILENFGDIWIGCLNHKNRISDPKTNSNKNYLEIEYSNIEILDLSTTANLFE